ncbi:hypothetical protein FOA52_011367 [Chlamydomonas sp. UWO 241]|nr:chloroplast ferredoxin-6 [Chlamydomonas sp. UWO 241]KAG1664189.1 hypothetical protein FOA52_011367 [Chlamydomonas sp. UWO 241]
MHTLASRAPGASQRVSAQHHHRSECSTSARSRTVVVCAQAPRTKEEAKTQAGAPAQKQQASGGVGGLGDVLGPIGPIGSDLKAKATAAKVASTSWVELGPIGMTVGGPGDGVRRPASDSGEPSSSGQSIHSMTTEEWRAKYEANGTVDLWAEEEFNAGSRLMGGRAVHNGGVYGVRTGEGPSQSDAVKHKVRIYNHYADQVVDVEVPEDRYVLWEAEDEGLELPYACRMGCCTACAVRVKEGELYQPEALGISLELREQGYALMCVAYPLSDCVLETVPEDEVYELQFGATFATQATDPSNAENIERDDFALEIATYDE